MERISNSWADSKPKALVGKYLGNCVECQGDVYQGTDWTYFPSLNLSTNLLVCEDCSGGPVEREDF